MSTTARGQRAGAAYEYYCARSTRCYGPGHVSTTAQSVTLLLHRRCCTTLRLRRRAIHMNQRWYGRASHSVCAHCFGTFYGDPATSFENESLPSQLEARFYHARFVARVRSSVVHEERVNTLSYATSRTMPYLPTTIKKPRTERITNSATIMLDRLAGSAGDDV